MRRNTLGVSWLVVALSAGAWGQAPEPARGLAAQTPAVVKTSPERRLALIFGNTKYQMKPLVNPVNDAHTMEAVLKVLGFSTEVVLDTTKAQMARRIVDFAARIGEGDTALLYYSGHGVQVSGENYLVPTDFHGADEIDLTSDSYPLRDALRRLAGSAAAFKFVFLDACRDNPFPGVQGDWKSGTAQVDLASRGFYIAFAASSDQEASDGKPGTNGVFTGLLAAELWATKPGEKIEDVMIRVIARIPKGQTPWVYQNLSRSWFPRGERVERGDGTPPPPPPPPTPTPDPVVALENIQQGHLRLRQSQFAEAEKFYTTAVEKDAQSGAAYVSRGLARGLQGKFDGAIADYTRAIELDRNDKIALFDRAMAYQRKGDSSSAIGDLSAVIALDKNYASAYRSRGTCYEAQGKYTEAEADLRRAVELNPKDTAALEILSAVHVKLKKTDQARQDLDAAEKAGGDRKRTLLRMAAAQEAIGDADGAAHSRSLAAGQSGANKP